jgi:hypothetical protein
MIGSTLSRAIREIKEGNWGAGIIMILTAIAVYYLYNWWSAAKWGMKERIGNNNNEIFKISSHAEVDRETDDSYILHRLLCSDGNCIGVINDMGYCKVCGKPYVGESN